MKKESRGIQSIEVGGQLLQALSRTGRPMMLRDLAAQAGMPPAKAHPYLVSFGKLGLVEQDTASGHYELGPLALEMGLVSLERLDPVRLATPEITALAERIGQSTALAVWGTHGPTIIRFEQSSHPIHVNMRTGTVMSLTHSATGLVFAAYQGPKMIESLVQAELARANASAAARSRAWKKMEAQMQEVRQHGLARVIGQPIPGINAFSAPVFDHTRHIVLALTTLGPEGSFRPEWNSPIARALREAAASVSRRLGYREVSMQEAQP